MTKKEIKQVLKDNSKSLGDTTVIYKTCYDDVVEDLYNQANSSSDIQNVGDQRELLIGFYQYLERSHMIKGHFDVNEVVKWFNPNNSR